MKGDDIIAIWITSDWHFNHNKEFIWKERGFNSIQEMNEAIIERHNEVVDKEDDVYVLGDCCLGDLELGRECISRLNGNLYIVCGNHESANRIKMYAELPNVKEVYLVGTTLKQGKYNFVLTHYPMFTGNKEKESPKQMRLNLYGHTHQKDYFYNDNFFMYHCGVDSHSCYPILLNNIISDIRVKAWE